MVLWQSDLRISWRAQWFSLLLHGVVAALVLLVPWPLSYTPIWLLLLSLVVFDCVQPAADPCPSRGDKTAHRFPSSLAKRRMGDPRDAVGYQ